MSQCSVSTCTYHASQTWALVPVCNGHYETIKREAEDFYVGHGHGTEAEKRPTYMKIAYRIPWSKMRIAGKGERNAVRRY